MGFDFTFYIVNFQENISLLNINRVNPSISSISNNTNFSLSFIERPEEIIFSDFSIPWSQQLLSERSVFDSFTFEISSTRRSYNNLVEPLNWQLNLQNFSIIRNVCFFNFNYFIFSTNIFAFKQFLIIAVFLSSFVRRASSRTIQSRNSNNLSTNINLTNYNRTIDPYSLTQSNSTILQPIPYISYLAGIILSSFFIFIIVLSQINVLRIHCFPSLSSFNCFSPRRRYYPSPSERSLSRSSSHISRASQRNFRDLNDPSEPNPTLSRSVGAEIPIESQEPQRMQSEETITQGELQPQETSQAEKIEEHELQEQSKLLEQSSLKLKEKEPLEDLNLFQEIPQERDTRENIITKNTDNIGSSCGTENQPIFPVNFVESYTHKGEAIEFQEQTVETSLDPPDVASFEIESLSSEISMDSEQSISETAEISDSISQSTRFESENDFNLILSKEYVEAKSITYLFQNKFKIILKFFQPCKTLEENSKVLILVCSNCFYFQKNLLKKKISRFLENHKNEFQNCKIIDYEMHHVLNRRSLLYPYEDGVTVTLPAFLNAREFERNSSEILEINKNIENFEQLTKHLKQNYNFWLNNFFNPFHDKITPSSNSICQDLKVVVNQALEHQVTELEIQFSDWNVSQKEIFLVVCLDRFLQDLNNVVASLKKKRMNYNPLYSIKYPKKLFITKRRRYGKIILCLEFLIFNYQTAIPLENKIFWDLISPTFHRLIEYFNQWNQYNSKYFNIEPVNICPKLNTLNEYLIKFDKGILLSKKDLNTVKLLFETPVIEKNIKDDQGNDIRKQVSIANTLHDPFPRYVRLEALCEAIIKIPDFQCLCPNLGYYVETLL